MDHRGLHGGRADDGVLLLCTPAGAVPVVCAGVPQFAGSCGRAHRDQQRLRRPGSARRHRGEPCPCSGRCAGCDRIGSRQGNHRRRPAGEHERRPADGDGHPDLHGYEPPARSGGATRERLCEGVHQVSGAARLGRGETCSDGTKGSAPSPGGQWPIPQPPRDEPARQGSAARDARGPTDLPNVRDQHGGRSRQGVSPAPPRCHDRALPGPGSRDRPRSSARGAWTRASGPLRRLASISRSPRSGAFRLRRRSFSRTTNS